ncbi:hypothetical protein LO771_19365 [Streptacidiphilus sp. ASG 303]|uniref:Rv1733c family protein n=1 Tax=Streptacidiphilus sp. ASG 303 TaxID=2896847 RepID=UPI001E613D9C|nr:hypothetical protein [Streptacidiphilus sp. ASG 303]MCD0484497.1 hypothetical protein [Streptacidiphilus sp. ASG 303]
MRPTAPQQRQPGRPGRAVRLRRALGRDGNPLWRPVDRARTRLASVVLLLAVVAVALSAAFSWTLYRSDLRAADALAAHRHRVAATTLAAAPQDGTWMPGALGPPVPARWHYPAQRTHTAPVPVRSGTPARSTVTVWVDDHGAPAGPLRSSADIVTGAVLAGFAALTGSALLCGSVQAVGRRRIDARTAAAWEREWEQVEPGWSGRSRSS